MANYNRFAKIFSFENFEIRSYAACYFAERNGTEPARNIPQDAKTRNGRFYNRNRHSGRFMKGARGYSPLLPLANCSVHYMNMILKVLNSKFSQIAMQNHSSEINSHMHISYLGQEIIIMV